MTIHIQHFQYHYTLYHSTCILEAFQLVVSASDKIYTLYFQYLFVLNHCAYISGAFLPVYDKVYTLHFQLYCNYADHCLNFGSVSRLYLSVSNNLYAKSLCLNSGSVSALCKCF